MNVSEIIGMIILKSIMNNNVGEGVMFKGGAIVEIDLYGGYINLSVIGLL
ncbi:hypothetical protein OO009_10960 [Flavobacteriaceae bacterium KMM 6897]|nr:hypothetical protein [Flavobacteriaceae bacterium KMM 6897]